MAEVPMTSMFFSLMCSSSLSAGAAGAHDPTAALVQAGATDLKSVAGGTLPGSVGIEEDCTLEGSWVGTNKVLPLAGVYSMTLTLTMIST